MGKKQTKEKHFTPSPFKVVTEYENEFIKKWNNNTADSVAELLQYMAKETAKTIKNKEVK